MTSEVTTKVASCGLRAYGSLLRTKEFEYRRGNGGSVILDDSVDPLALEEAELLHHLEEVRRQKAARN